jgi:hypothetical protein
LGNQAVLSEQGKGRPRGVQVRIKEMNESEPLMTCRNKIKQRQNRGDKVLAGISTEENLSTDRAAFGIKVA